MRKLSACFGVAHAGGGAACQEPGPIDGHVAGMLLDAVLERLQGRRQMAQRKFGLSQIDQGLGPPQAGFVAHV